MAHSVLGSQIACATIFDVAYGIKALPEDDPVLKLAEETFTGVVSALIPGRFLVELVPIPKYVSSRMPGASFQRPAQEGESLLRDTAEVPLDQVKRAMLGDPLSH